MMSFGNGLPLAGSFRVHWRPFAVGHPFRHPRFMPLCDYDYDYDYE